MGSNVSGSLTERSPLGPTVANHRPSGLNAATEAWPGGLRNRIVHGYWSIDLGILLPTNQLPGFVAQLQAARDALDDAGEDDGTTDCPAPPAD